MLAGGCFHAHVLGVESQWTHGGHGIQFIPYSNLQTFQPHHVKPTRIGELKN